MKTIKILFSDIDGTLTDGSLYYGELSGGETMAFTSFHVKDGMGIVQWKKLGNIFGVLSGRENDSVRRRLNDLQIEHVGLKIADKKTWLNDWLQEHNYDWSQVAFIGDDINDVEVMQHVGHCACPADAVEEAKQAAKYICKRDGGQGAVREYIDFLLKKR